MWALGSGGGAGAGPGFWVPVQGLLLGLGAGGAGWAPGSSSRTWVLEVVRVLGLGSRAWFGVLFLMLGLGLGSRFWFWVLDLGSGSGSWPWSLVLPRRPGHWVPPQLWAPLGPSLATPEPCTACTNAFAMASWLPVHTNPTNLCWCWCWHGAGASPFPWAGPLCWAPGVLIPTWAQRCSPRAPLRGGQQQERDRGDGFPQPLCEGEPGISGQCQRRAQRRARPAVPLAPCQQPVTPSSPGVQRGR